MAGSNSDTPSRSAPQGRDQSGEKQRRWMPACAGMTRFGLTRDYRFGTNRAPCNRVSLPSLSVQTMNAVPLRSASLG